MSALGGPTTDELSLERAPSRYVVGIDLGTTNSAVCYVDCERNTSRVEVLAIPQFTAANVVEKLDTLPSFLYQPAADRAALGKLPWNDDSQPIVGAMARDAGAISAGRVISSAKSWLCHRGVDRLADVLPWQAAPDVERMSPVEASSRYLAHIRAAWNHQFKGAPLEEQEIVLTLPASFDEVARELTISAAQRAGLPRVVLLEEPQAAFYAWIAKHRDTWQAELKVGQKILICDVGGGTTDFTLIRVRQDETGQIQLHRIAVGDHLILGGDNFDLALAKHLEEKLAVTKGLDARQWDTLLRASRSSKEELLSQASPTERTISIASGGSRLIGGSLQTTITRDEAATLLVEGFFPKVPRDARPQARRSGFQEFGLPYAADPAITRYLAQFLARHRYADVDPPADPQAIPTPPLDPAKPDLVLLNGGVFSSPLLVSRLLETIGEWFTGDRATPWQPRLLDNDRLDLAVARGAAYYGLVRRGLGVKIAASLARSYYLGLEGTPPQAICLVPGSAQPGETITLKQPALELLVSQPAQFPLFVSSLRLADRAGEVLPIDPEQMSALPPIRTALKTRTRGERGTIAVHLNVLLTEIGTLELWCSEAEGERQWRLEFDVRSATETDAEAHESAAEAQGFIEESAWKAIYSVLEGTFGTGREHPDSLIKRLVEAAGSDREQWPTSLLRRIWEALIALEEGRRRSPAHEARWLNLLGYALRPGYGLAVDDWRVAETWKLVHGKLAHGVPTSRTESLILWRRIAGGFTAGQQKAISQPMLTTLKAFHKRATSAGKSSEPMLSPHESIELVRLVGSLELLDVPTKITLGQMFLELLGRPKLANIRAALAWSIGRLGSRVPVYGPLNTVLPASEVATWLEKLLATASFDVPLQLAIVQLARKTDDRFRDISTALRATIAAQLTASGASDESLKLVEQGGDLDSLQQRHVFGESLPIGLRIR